MKVKQQIINFYQILKELPDNEEYNVEGIRNRVSMKADNLLFTLDNKGNQGIDIDAKIFSFLSFGLPMLLVKTYSVKEPPVFHLQYRNI